MDPYDHRMLGPRLDLFHQQEEGPGAAFWHPRGARLYRMIESYIHGQMRRAGFNEVRTPQLLAKSLWERSGHWAKFGPHMFVFTDGERNFALKPMNCPGHVQLFRERIRSYRDLPLRLCEFGACHRYEPSGALHGLMRARAFTQDDAHVFCMPEQVDAEVSAFCQLLRRIYARFGFHDVIVGFSTRPAQREGSDAIWDRAEAALAAAGTAAGLRFRMQPGEGAFYGPKLEFILQDRDGREWQCGTIQLDLVLPEKLGAEAINPAGSAVRPVLIHHAVLGSFERFIAVLLEHHRGKLPFWLAPDQVMVAPLSAAQAGYARCIAERFEAGAVRCVVEDANVTLARRIVLAHEQAIPVLAIAGPREMAAGSVTLRHGAGRQQAYTIEQAAAWLNGLAASGAEPAATIGAAG